MAILLAVVAVAGAAEKRDEWQQPDRVVADLGLKAGMTVADVGCGSGYLTLRMARTVEPNGKVLAADIDTKALDRLRQSIASRRLTNIVVVQSDPTNTCLGAGVADAAVLCNVVHEVPADQRAAVVKDVARSLKPGGVLHLLDWRKSREITFDPYDKLVPRDDLIKMATDAGLVLDAEFHYLKYQVFLRLRKP